MLMLRLYVYMQHFIKFIVDNWYILLEAFLLILSIIILIIKKPTNKVVSGLFENLYKWCIDAIKAAEETGETGDRKLSTAILFVLQTASAHYPDINVSKYRALIETYIEDILSTPVKKGGYGREK